jgi:hypothetical protein
MWSLHKISRTGRTGTACLGRLEPGNMHGERYPEWLNVKLTVIDSSLFLSFSDVPTGSELLHFGQSAASVKQANETLGLLIS